MTGGGGDGADGDEGDDDGGGGDALFTATRRDQARYDPSAIRRYPAWRGAERSFSVFGSAGETQAELRGYWDCTANLFLNWDSSQLVRSS